MKTSSDAERDTIAWFRVDIVITSTLVGLTSLFSGASLAAYVFLGYALYGATMMLIFKSWRGSSEVDKARKRHWKRFVEDIPRSILRLFLSIVAFVIVVAIGAIPLFFTSNDFYDQYENIINVYIYFLVAISFFVTLWVSGFFKNVRRSISEIKEINRAAKEADARRAKEKHDKNLSS